MNSGKHSTNTIIDVESLEKSFSCNFWLFFLRRHRATLNFFFFLLNFRISSQVSRIKCIFPSVYILLRLLLLSNCVATTLFVLCHYFLFLFIQSLLFYLVAKDCWKLAIYYLNEFCCSEMHLVWLLAFYFVYSFSCYRTFPLLFFFQMQWEETKKKTNVRVKMWLETSKLDKWSSSYDDIKATPKYSAQIRFIALLCVYSVKIFCSWHNVYIIFIKE